jgi:hypothetical protein
MPALRELQASFWNALVRPEEAAPPVLDAIAPGGSLPPPERLGIYRHMYEARLVEALAADYPKLAQTLGDAAFGALARAYVRRHPSRHPSLRHLGAALPAFVAAAPPAGPPFLADLARLEWARSTVFDAPDEAIMTLDALRAVKVEDWPALVFTPSAALAVLVCDWPVHRLWDESPAPLVAQRTAVRVWRQDFRVYQTAMAADEEEALARVRRGEPFAAVCEACDGAPTAAALLLRWVEDGLLAGPRAGGA